MGMSIDNAISAIEMVQTQLEITNQPRSLAFDTAIDTMRKYQKIQEIYLKWNRNYDIQTSSAWIEVIEVLENGKID